MEIKGASKALILVASATGFLVCPATWIYLARNLTYTQQEQLFENWYSLGYVALLASAVIGIASMYLGVIVAFPKKEEQSRDNPEAFHGTARFASRKEIAELTLPDAAQLAPGSFILAPDGEQGRGAIALSRLATAQHGIILGGSGTGKSRGYFLPNCAAARNASLVVTDPKSELWNYTSGFHPRARRYAPADPEASEGFNWIPLCRDARIAELCARAVMESGNIAKTDQFWIDAEAAYLGAIFAHKHSGRGYTVDRLPTFHETEAGSTTRAAFRVTIRDSQRAGDYLRADRSAYQRFNRSRRRVETSVHARCESCSLHERER